MTRPRLLAFLRAINVGGHTVKMDRLRALFEALGLDSVETFIASGNVIFDPPVEARERLERRIEAHLGAALGYPVATFLRTPAEVVRIAECRPLSAAEQASAGALNVAFLHSSLNARARARLAELQTADDRFFPSGRELYWWCRTRQSESSFSNAVLEKELGVVATIRGLRTVARLAAKYPPEPRAGFG